MSLWTPKEGMAMIAGGFLLLFCVSLFVEWYLLAFVGFGLALVFAAIHDHWENLT